MRLSGKVVLQDNTSAVTIMSVLESTIKMRHLVLVRSKKNYQHYMDMFINTKMLLDEQIDYCMLNPYSLFKSIAIISILRHKLKIPLKDLLYHTPSLLLKISYIISSFVSVLSPYPKISKEK